MRRVGSVAIVVVACAIALLLGFLVKALCPERPSSTYPATCYSDIRALYAGRALDEQAIPYLDLRPGGRPGDPGFLEYPVLTGAVMYLTALPVRSAGAFLAANAFVLGGVALACAWALSRRFGVRALRFAAAPALALYAFHNWDLVAVGCLIAGGLAHADGRHRMAATWFGLGGAAKLFPALLLVPLVAERLWTGDRRGAFACGVAGAAALLLPNLAAALANPGGWLATYAFHSGREADLGSIWAWVLPADLPGRALNLVTGAGSAVGALVVLGIAQRRAAREGAYPFHAAAAGLIVVALLFSKIASPQYALWLLPAFVFLSLRWRWSFVWNATAALVYAVSFGVGIAGYEAAAAPTAIGVVAGLRALVLVALLGVIVRARDAGRLAPISWQGGTGAAPDRVQPEGVRRAGAGPPASIIER